MYAPIDRPPIAKMTMIINSTFLVLIFFIYYRSIINILFKLMRLSFFYKKNLISWHIFVM
ncbi:MAG: hypothetical protein BZ133_00435 [Methanosphaera sp. SHI613]|nr:MAG: hypothetical protein BZ133_00435 [Methanosphaera sp. SHI613]